ncbi:MAG: shikimate kinase [Verrucomicrobiota bacterium]
MQRARKIENIALIGFMGTGKTTVGHALAGLLHFQFLDTDDLIEHRAQQKISDIFRTDGEARFRELERQVVAELANCRRVIIATGGGLAANGDNLASLQCHALVVCLWASVETIWERVRHQTHRPLLHDPDPRSKIERLLAERAPFYRQADVLVNTEVRSVREVAYHVAHQYRVSRKLASGEIEHPTAGH